jgi:hypothetical protein
VPVLNTDAGYRKLFIIAGLYNIILGLAFLLFFSRLMVLFHMPPALREPTLFSRMAILLAMSYGAGYLMVSRDLYGQRGIVLLGILAKSLVFVLFLYHFLFSGLHAAAFSIGVGDLAFALLFVKFLAFTGGRAAPGSP